MYRKILCIVYYMYLCVFIFRMTDCLKGIMKTCNDLPGNKQWDNPKDCITYMLDTHILEKDSCYDPEADDINTILSHVVYIINNKYKNDVYINKKGYGCK